MKTIKITENELKDLIKESVQKILMEDNGPYSSGNINTSVYGGLGSGYDRYQQDIENRHRLERQRDAAARERQRREQGEAEYAALQRQNQYNDETLVRNLSLKVKRFYSMLKSYEEKGMLRKFFSSRPKFEDYGLSGKDLRQLYSVCKNSPDLVDNIAPKLRSCVAYLHQLRLI
jgi:hypothetical protein